MKLVAFDVETSGTLPEYALQPHRLLVGKAWLTSVAWAKRDPAGEVQISGMLDPDVESLRAFLVAAREEGRAVVCWNAPFDVAWLIACGLRDEVYRTRWLDAMLLWKHLTVRPDFAMADGKRQQYGLKDAVRRYLPEYADYEKGVEFHAQEAAARDALLRYNQMDAQFTLLLAEKFLTAMPKAMKRNALIEARAISMVAETYVEGLPVSTLAAITLRRKLRQARAYSLARLAVEEGVTEEVLNSPKQLSQLLFQTWGLPVQGKSEKTGEPSTDKDTLDLLKDIDPRAKLVRDFREAGSLATKFCESTIKSARYNGLHRGVRVVRPQARIYGTYCVPGHVEVLTKNGWVALQDWSGGEIMQVRPDLTMEFLPATRFVGPLTSEWIRVEHQGLRASFTPGHTVPYIGQTGAWRTMPAGELLDAPTRLLPVAGNYVGGGSQLTEDQARVIAMAQADGYFSQKGLRFMFKKDRKKERCRHLLAAAGLTFREYVCAAYADRTEFTITKMNIPEWLSEDCKRLGPWLLDLSAAALAAFVDEVQHWDGSSKDGGVSYSTSIRSNAEWVATAASLVGRKASVHAPDRGIHVARLASAASEPTRAVRGQDHVTVETVERVAYCAVTQTGFWLARSEGTIFITGNTGRMTYSSKQGKGKAERPTGVALHQWKRSAEFRRIIKAPPGYVLCEFDFAGQEFRWMAVASGDETMLTLCEPGEDAHAYMGARIARTSYKSMRTLLASGDSEAKSQRQVGKVANLSLQYRTSAKTLQLRARTDYGITLSDIEAKAIHATYQLTYHRVPEYWRRQIHKGRAQGYVETPAGRRVWLGRGADWPPDMVWSYESTTINFPIQGAGADQKYLALCVISDYLPKVNGRFAYELHDGLFFFIPTPYAQKAVREMRDILSNLPYEKAWGVKLPIRFPVDAKIGPSWGELTEVHD